MVNFLVNEVLPDIFQEAFYLNTTNQHPPYTLLEIVEKHY